MRYRVQITRVQVAERNIHAKDEDHALEKVRAELNQQYGWFGRWDTKDTHVEIVAAEPPDGLVPTYPNNGPMLLSIKDAGTHLGFSYQKVYELVNAGEIDHVKVGRRTYISRDALTKFIDTHTRTGYQAEYRR